MRFPGGAGRLLLVAANIPAVLPNCDPDPGVIVVNIAEADAGWAVFMTALAGSRHTRGRPIHRGPLMVHDNSPHLGSCPPQPDGSSPVVNYLYCDDVDATISRALAAGAKLLMPAADQFWGDRVGRIMDPAHHVWNVAARANP